VQNYPSLLKDVLLSSINQLPPTLLAEIKSKTNVEESSYDAYFIMNNVKDLPINELHIERICTKACRLISKIHVFSDGIYIVPSESEATPHTVIYSCKAVKCDCRSFKSKLPCSHLISVATYTKNYELLLKHFTEKPNITRIFKGKEGKKKGRKPGTKRKGGRRPKGIPLYRKKQSAIEVSTGDQDESADSGDQVENENVDEDNSISVYIQEDYEVENEKANENSVHEMEYDQLESENMNKTPIHSRKGKPRKRRRKVCDN